MVCAQDYHENNMYGQTDRLPDFFRYLKERIILLDKG